MISSEQIWLIVISGMVLLVGMLVLMWYFSRPKQPPEEAVISSEPVLEDEKDFLKLLFNQSWLHIRHVENHRLWFTNMYFVMVAGVFAYLGNQTPKSTVFMFPLLIGFLFSLSLMGLALCLKTTKVHNAYTDALERILMDALETKRENLRGYLGFRLIKSPEGIFGKRVESVSFIYKALYVVSVFIWLILLFSSLSGLLS